MPIKTIESIDKYIQNETIILKKFILSILIRILTYNHKGLDNILEEENIIKNIEENNTKIISNNFNQFSKICQKFKVEQILNNIDEIYIEIIKGLIIQNNFNDYEYIIDILESLDFKNIHLTKTMLNKLPKILLKRQ